MGKQPIHFLRMLHLHKSGSPYHPERIVEQHERVDKIRFIEEQA
jgi:hypothetical protein